MNIDISSLPKKERREYAREIARIQREAEQKRKKRNRVLWQSGIIVGTLAIVAIVSLVIVNGVRGAGTGPANMLSDGILFTGDGSNITATTTAALQPGEDPVATAALPEDSQNVQITVYLDYLCPYCGTFETTNAEQLQQMVQSGYVSLEIHPIAILDKASLGTKYSTRAANAAACVANYVPDSFLAVNNALFTNQPAENTVGLTNEELNRIITDAGVDSKQVTDCVNNGSFTGWVTAATERANTGPIPNSDLAKIKGTPTILVNGQQYTGAIDDPDAFITFIASVIQPADDAATDGGTEAPTDESTETPAE